MSYLSQKQRVVTLQSTKVVAVLKEGSTGDTMNPLFMQFLKCRKSLCCAVLWGIGIIYVLKRVHPSGFFSLAINIFFSCGFYLLKLNNH